MNKLCETTRCGKGPVCGVVEESGGLRIAGRLLRASNCEVGELCIVEQAGLQSSASV